MTTQNAENKRGPEKEDKHLYWGKVMVTGPAVIIIMLCKNHVFGMKNIIT